jgi:hypothetical protein
MLRFDPTTLNSESNPFVKKKPPGSGHNACTESATTVKTPRGSPRLTWLTIAIATSAAAFVENC